MYIFKDKIVWVTGASSGIGKEMAIQLAAQGAIVVLSSRNEEKLIAIKEKLKKVVHFHTFPVFWSSSLLGTTLDHLLF